MTAPASFVQSGGPRNRRADHFGIRAWATTHCALDAIPQFKQELGLPGDKPFPAAFLKPSDEQTVVAVAAVLKAINQHGLEKENFANWGVIAAPRFLGRIGACDTIYKFETGGAWKASPLFVPHRSLHAVSGTISQALQSRGPNFGVGGGINAPVEGLLSTLTLLDDYPVPGLWVVLTQCDPEPRPDHQGHNDVPVFCHALALAFMPVADDWKGLRAHLIEAKAQTEGKREQNGPERCAVFDGLTQFFEQGKTDSRFGTWSCALKWGCELQLTDEA